MSILGVACRIYSFNDSFMGILEMSCPSAKNLMKARRDCVVGFRIVPRSIGNSTSIVFTIAANVSSPDISRVNSPEIFARSLRCWGRRICIIQVYVLLRIKQREGGRLVP